MRRTGHAFILVTVAIIDALTSKVRHQLIGREERR